MNRIPYKIFENFSNIKEKECVDADKQNEILYKQTCKKVNGAIMIINKSGITIRTSISDENIRVMGRATQGVKLIKLAENDEISSVAKIENIEGEEEE